MKKSKGRNSGKKIWTSLLRTGALVAGLVTGYYHRVFGGSCYYTGPGTYLCTGAADPGTDTTITLFPGSQLTVTTQSGFGIDTSPSSTNALYLYGKGGCTFTDTYQSQITGLSGLRARNSIGGALSITTSGTVNGTSTYFHRGGLHAVNDIGTTDLTISANNVYSSDVGISAVSRGSGVLSVTATGTVRGDSYGGMEIIHHGHYGTGLTISANNVYGNIGGIWGWNQSSGALSITASGTVTATTQYGIWALNEAYGTDLTVSANHVNSGNDGITARNYGSGTLSITTAGTVTGTTTDGIWAYSLSNGTDLTISANHVAGGDDGIYADNQGSGALSVTATGTVAGTGGDGIWAYNDGTGLTISANHVTGGDDGIYAKKTMAAARFPSPRPAR